MDTQPRVVVTGMGVVAPNGIGLDAFWDSLIHCKSGIGPITLFDSAGLRCQIAGEVRGFNPYDHMDSELKPERRMSRASQFAIAAARMAFDDASFIGPSQDIPLVNGGQAGDLIRVDVADTGCGIAPENLSKIFDPFFTTKEDGVGLGLSVSHGIIQEHNGTIDVESEKGVGTVFHVHFPLLKLQEKTKE